MLASLHVTMLARVLLAHRMLRELLSTTALTSHWMTEWYSRHDQDKNDHVNIREPWDSYQILILLYCQD